MLYCNTNSLLGKKILVHFFDMLMGIFLLFFARFELRSVPMEVRFIACLALFDEAGSGTCFALVPRVRPTSNGISRTFTP